MSKDNAKINPLEGVPIADRMERYIGTKIIKAFPMNRRDYNDLRGWALSANDSGDDNGYLVEYLDSDNKNCEGFDHYISWSPAKEFENAYRPATGLSFGMALEALKHGRRVARTGWNGKGMFIFLLPGNQVPFAAIHDRNLLNVLREELGEDEMHFDALPSIRMFTADKKILTGWLASQTDMLSDDWEIVGTV